MSSFVNDDAPSEREHRRALAQGVNAALRGETANSGRFLLAANATSFLLINDRIGAGKIILLSPLDIPSARLQWWVDESTLQKGQVTIRFLSSPGAECMFRFVIFGTINKY